MIACALFEPFALWRAVRANPDLIDKPLITLEKGNVKEASGLASQLGITVGMSKQGAHSRCTNLHVIETDDVTLQNEWGEVLGELYSFTDQIESHAPGLVFLELAERAAGSVSESFDVPVGVGDSQEIAHLRALAGDDVDGAPVAVLESIALSPKNTERLEWLGIETVGQLKRWSKAHLSRFLGKESKLISRYLKGPFTKTVSRYTPAGTLKESYSFEDAVTEPCQILPVLEHLSKCLASDLGDRAAARLSVTALASGIRFSSSRLSKHVLRGERVYPLALLALEDCGALGLGLGSLSVELSGLYRPSEQGVLWQQRENIATAKARVEARFPGAILTLELINPFMPVSEFAYRFRCDTKTHASSMRAGQDRNEARCETKAYRGLRHTRKDDREWTARAGD